MKSLRKGGLTLIEVIIAMGIVAALGMLLSVIIINSSGLFSKQSAKVQEGLNVNDTLSEVRSVVKQASAVADQAIDGSTTYTTGADTLVLKVLSIDSSNNLIKDTYDFFVFFSNQGILHFKTLPDASSSRQKVDRVLANMVNNLNFQYFNSDTPPLEVSPTSATKVKITLTLQQKAGANNERITATSEADLRND